MSREVSPFPAADDARRQVRLGIWQSIPSPAISRYLTIMGWPWIVLDLQHGPMSMETACECIHAIRTGGGCALVRPPIGAMAEIQKALDMGAQGIVAPMVNSVGQARQAAAAAKYPPLGQRSMGGDLTVHFGEDYPERANDQTLLLVQVEHIQAVEQAENLMAVEGVDGCFVGPTDLALSMGLSRTNYRDDPQHRQAMQRILDACSAVGKLACCNTYSFGDFREKVEQGFDAITFMSEVDLLLSSGKLLLSQLSEYVDVRESSA